MWRGGAPEDDEEVASSFASSQSRSVDSNADRRAQSDWRRPTETHDDDDEDDYEDEAFEGYADEFESDDDDENEAEKQVDIQAQDAAASGWRTGDRVQVYWEEECAWFDGVVGRVDRTRCFVEYADGEQQWEDDEDTRGAPPDQASDAAQLQKLQVDTEGSTLVGRRVVVYWEDERDWFDGRITDIARADATHRIRVVYDDGDDKWLAQASFRDVLVLSPAVRGEEFPTEPSDCTTGRVVTPRPYLPAVEHHFEPIRVACKYKPTVHNHIGSVLTPRSWDRRPYFLPRVVAQLDCDPHVIHSKKDSFTVVSRECQVQTEISVDHEYGQPASSTDAA